MRATATNLGLPSNRVALGFTAGTNVTKARNGDSSFCILTLNPQSRATRNIGYKQLGLMLSCAFRVFVVCWIMDEAIPGNQTPILSMVAAMDWVQSLLLGAVGTSAAVLAVAGIGLAMMQGCMPPRRGMLIVIGCFTVFSARTIAASLLNTGPDLSFEVAILPVAPSAYVASVPPPVAYDPYAGASVPVRHVSNQNMLPQ